MKDILGDFWLVKIFEFLYLSMAPFALHFAYATFYDLWIQQKTISALFFFISGIFISMLVVAILTRFIRNDYR